MTDSPQLSFPAAANMASASASVGGCEEYTAQPSASEHVGAVASRRPLQALDANRLAMARDARASPLLHDRGAPKFQAKETVLVRAPAPSTAARPVQPETSRHTSRSPPSPSAPTLKRKHHTTTTATIATIATTATATTTATASVLSITGAMNAAVDLEQQQRENHAWLDVLVALLERRYGASAPAIHIEDLHTTKRRRSPARTAPATSESSIRTAERCGRERSSETLDGATSATKREATSVDSEDTHARETRRLRALRRHALQIEQTSVTSTTCCGCKTGCLKMYCVCFSTRGYCHKSCNCGNCKNSRENTAQRVDAIQTYLLNDPRAFSFASQHTTATTGFYQLLPEKSTTVVLRGCRCKKSKCLKKYCECFQNGLGCTPHCRCVDCANDASAAARELRAQTQAQAQTQRQPRRSAFHDIHVAVTKKPRRNYAQKSVRLRL